MREKNGDFTFGKNAHICEMDPGINVRMKIRKEVYDRVDKGDTANEETMKIIEETLLKYHKTVINHSLLPDPVLLARSTNRRRAKQFPRNPQRNNPNFDFTPYLEHKTMPPEFFQKEIWVGEGKIEDATFFLLRNGKLSI